jgi:hypothetical protein
MAGSCEHGNASFGCIEDEKFLNYVIEISRMTLLRGIS